MIRLLVNAIGTLLLAQALVFAVGDIARSLAQDDLRITALGDAMGSVGLSIAPGNGVSTPTADLLALISSWPAAPVLAAAALLVLLVGRPRDRRRDRAMR